MADSIRKHIIEADETLIAVVCSQRIKRSFVRESSFFGKQMTDADMLDELSDDEIVAVRRLNVETWVSEDITELCARKYLYAKDGDGGIELSDEDRFPAYVKNSRAWALWRDDYPATKVYSATREHGTLSHRVQGVGA